MATRLPVMTGKSVQNPGIPGCGADHSGQPSSLRSATIGACRASRASRDGEASGPRDQAEIGSAPSCAWRLPPLAPGSGGSAGRLHAVHLRPLRPQPGQRGDQQVCQPERDQDRRQPGSRDQESAGQPPIGMPARAAESASAITRPSRGRGICSQMTAPMIGLMNPRPRPPTAKVAASTPLRSAGRTGRSARRPARARR
jgi:hypothetical protein